MAGLPRCVLVSTYEMSRQPFGLASAEAFLRTAGETVRCVDTAKQRLGPQAFEGAALVGFHLPMHTATRLAGPLITRARKESPHARICAFGLYAPLNAAWLRSLGVDAVFGGEFEDELTAWATSSSFDPSSRADRLRTSGSESPVVVSSSNHKRRMPRIDRKSNV